MKKFVLSICVFMTVYTASNAQFSAKDVIIGGNFNYTYDDSKNSSDRGSSTDNYLTITPNVAYMLTKSVAIGIDLGLRSSNSSYTIDNIFTTNGNTFITTKSSDKLFAPSIFIQKFNPISTNLFWSVKAEFGYGWGKRTNGADSQKYTLLELGISPELDYFLSKKIGLRANFNGLNYSHTSYKEDKTDNRFSIYLNPSYWAFGVFVKL